MDNSRFFLTGPPQIPTSFTSSGVLHGSQPLRFPQPGQLPIFSYTTPYCHTTSPLNARCGNSPRPGPCILPPTQRPHSQKFEDAKQDIEKQLAHQHEQRSKEYEQTSNRILILEDKVERLASKLESLRTEEIERIPVNSEELLMLEAKRQSQALEATVEPTSRSTKVKHRKSVATKMKFQRRSQRLWQKGQKS